MTASPWLIDNAELLPRGGRVLDVACGRGRNALWLAQSGFVVRAIDRNAEAIAALGDQARQLSLDIATAVVDLETNPPPDLGHAVYDAIVVFNYLHRPLFPSLRAAVKPGGVIVYQTFTTRQAELGHPRNPAFLLRDGELAELVAPFEILKSRQGEFDGSFIASIVARRPVERYV
jgi:SAM-dependent methyltransferase